MLSSQVCNAILESSITFVIRVLFIQVFKKSWLCVIVIDHASDMGLVHFKERELDMGLVHLKERELAHNRLLT